LRKKFKQIKLRKIVIFLFRKFEKKKWKILKIMIFLFLNLKFIIEYNKNIINHLHKLYIEYNYIWQKLQQSHQKLKKLL
jgi:hypothetical protein